MPDAVSPTFACVPSTVHTSYCVVWNGALCWLELPCSMLVAHLRLHAFHCTHSLVFCAEKRSSWAGSVLRLFPLGDRRQHCLPSYTFSSFCSVLRHGALSYLSVSILTPIWPHNDFPFPSDRWQQCGESVLGGGPPRHGSEQGPPSGPVRPTLPRHSITGPGLGRTHCSPSPQRLPAAPTCGIRRPGADACLPLRS